MSAAALLPQPTGEGDRMTMPRAFHAFHDRAGGR
jgi:hypothetical protein